MPRKNLGKTQWAVVAEARQQRREPTPAEARLWGILRKNHLAGVKFRRQHPFGPFILDFFCAEYQLCIEVDGVIHTTPAQTARDVERTAFLNARGVRVLRFTNAEVLNALPAVRQQIVAFIISLKNQPGSPT